jgi:hypothetical protein
MVFHARAVGLRSSSAKSRFWRAHFGELLGGQLEIIQRLASGAVEAVEKDGLGHGRWAFFTKETGCLWGWGGGWLRLNWQIRTHGLVR